MQGLVTIPSGLVWADVYFKGTSIVAAKTMLNKFKLDIQRAFLFAKTASNMYKNNYSLRASLILATCYLLLASCNSTFVPKPRGYFNIPLPQHQYQVFDQPGFPYSFEIPVYAKVVQDTTFFDAKPENPWWINIDFPQFNSRSIYVSYKDLANNDFGKMVNDAFKMTYKHTTKATSINDSLMQTPNGLHGVYFTVGGKCCHRQTVFPD